MKKINTFLIALFMLAGFNLTAQVAISTDGSSADGSAMLDVKSTDKGFLPPRMTEAQIIAIANPANGLIVFNITDGKYYAFVSIANKWKEILYGSGTIIPFACGQPFIDDRDSRSYTTIQIGTQCWMAQNLNVGTRIDATTAQADNSTIEKYCYSNDENNCDIYGGLYQWDEMMQYVTAEGARGICPEGWHLPTDAEWTVLIDYLGGENIAGGKMKEVGTTHWASPNTDATNSSGFTGLPGGIRHTFGTFYYLGNYGSFWSSSETSTPNAWYRDLGYSYANAYRSDLAKGYGFSVRCLRD